MAISFCLTSKFLGFWTFTRKFCTQWTRTGWCGFSFPSKFLPYNPYFVDEIAKVERLELQNFQVVFGHQILFVFFFFLWSANQTSPFNIMLYICSCSLSKSNYFESHLFATWKLECNTKNITKINLLVIFMKTS